MEKDNEMRRMPEDESCGHGLIPRGAEGRDGSRTLQVAAGLKTMTRLFFDDHRIGLYRKLNRWLRSGRLRENVGFPFRETGITRKECEFTRCDFWRIDRESFRAEVQVQLTLTGETGDARTWHGMIPVECEFGEETRYTVGEIVAAEEAGDHSGEIPLSAFLVPVMNRGQMDAFCEELWEEYIPGASMKPEKRSAEALAERVGLKVRYLPVDDDQGVGSIVFFEAGPLAVRPERKQRGETEPEDEAEDLPVTEWIPAGTVVVNTLRVREEYAAFAIFHEVIHWELHFLFHRLQKKGNSDLRGVATEEIILRKGDRITDPLYWMEKQANRGAFALMMPAEWMRGEIALARREAPLCRHEGELCDIIGRRISRKHHLPVFRVRARMIQVGCIGAVGAMVLLPGPVQVRPFAFGPDRDWQVGQSYVIGAADARTLYRENGAYRRICDTGEYVWAGGHMARRDACTAGADGRLRLTEWGNAHVDECCLRFERVYVQKLPGKFVFGRMNFDEDYQTRTDFFLDRQRAVMRETEGNEQDRPRGSRETEGNEQDSPRCFRIGRMRSYREDFPADYYDALRELREESGVRTEDLEEALGMATDTFRRALRRRIGKLATADFVVAFSLALQLPDWISSLLMDRAGLQLSESNPRACALRWILRTGWTDGIRAANETLKEMGFAPLSY